MRLYLLIKCDKIKTKNNGICHDACYSRDNDGIKKKLGCTKKQVYDRLYQACNPTNQGNAESFVQVFKQANSNLSNCYHDSSMFTASLRRVRMKANLQRLKEKELRVAKERRDIRFKHKAIKQIQETQHNFKFSVNKLIVMPISDILKKKHQILTALQ